MKYQHATGEYIQTDTGCSKEHISKDEGFSLRKSTRYIHVVLDSNVFAKSMDKTGMLNDTCRRLPELYHSRECCCGCAACYSICPMDAILMDPDEEGFLYPVVDAMKCIRCGKCMSVCPFNE